MNGNDAAFPFQVEPGNCAEGLAKREYIAVAMAAAIRGASMPHGLKPHEVAEAAVIQADALIAELSKPVKVPDHVREDDPYIKENE